VLLAQGYQDLSGQIIRGVMKLVAELETALVDLVRLSRTGPQGLGEPAPASESPSRGFGPTIPGIDNGPAAIAHQLADDFAALVAFLPQSLNFFEYLSALQVQTQNFINGSFNI
jgi:chemotaxis protein CheZ